MAELLHDLLFATAAARPDGTAVIDREAAISYETLTATVDGVAGGLVSLGVGRGERVATLLPKRFEKVAALFGALRAGAVAVPMNPLLRAPQIRHILSDCDVRSSRVQSNNGESDLKKNGAVDCSLIHD